MIGRASRGTALILAALVCAAPAAAEMKMPSIFSEGMVLQRDMPVPIWGWADDGEKVTVAIQGQTVSTVAAGGKWRVTLKPLKAGGPYRLTVRGRKPLTFKDVLVGEVWFTAGQSNMMMAITSAEGGEAAVAAMGKYPNLRVVSQLGGHLRKDTPQRNVRASWGRPDTGYSAVSLFFAQKLYHHLGGKVPVGMITYTAIVPAEGWVDAETIAAAPALCHLPNSALKVASKCYNAVIAPTAPYAIRGVLYYQAEYNGGRHLEFRTLMPALIGSWRRAWARKDLPFLFVQLPGFERHLASKDAKLDMDPATLAGLHRPGGSAGWAGMREAQLLTWQSTPHTGMAITIDVGDPWDIHPRKKEPVAERLLRSARHVAYGERFVYSGPVPRRVEAKADRLVVHFDHVGGGLVTKDSRLTGFDVAGPDLKFVRADARIEGRTVVVRHPAGKRPVVVRYAWAGYPQYSLYNREGLPATPFRHRVPGQVFQPPTASFAFRNAGFEAAGKSASAAAEWTMSKGAARTREKASQGAWSVKLPRRGAGIVQNRIADGLGYTWNCEPVAELAVRPGCVAGYSVDVAVAKGAGEQAGYMRLCQNSSATGYRNWGGIPLITTRSETFVRRHVAHLFADWVRPGRYAGALFANHLTPRRSKAEGALFLDNFSAVTILRPVAQISGTRPIDLGTVKPGQKRDAPVRTITNAQRCTLGRLLSDGQRPAAVATVLYGLAGMKRDGKGFVQRLTARTDHVGVILIGEQADKFALVGEHAAADGRSVKLIGQDGRGGLLGGPKPETERFVVRFVGSDASGRYRAIVRIVTQAGNVGVISTCRPGEPPFNLHYVDIPVAVVVGR